ncbi:MAG: SPFH domain-containing protein [Candidatus Latescibacter sp.]|nr:SPFH domain-containing protein [Candidatus Latescibacter sp.]
MEAIREYKAWRFNGFLALLLILAACAIEFFLMRTVALNHAVALLWIAIPLAICIAVSFGGYVIVQPNEARVLIFFGRYAGSVRDAGFWWANPLTVKRRVSLRINNFTSEKLKVNDLNGNPIEIAVVVVWRVVDSAKATFDVESYQQFVNIQSETAIRSMASQYPYDAHDDSKPSLRVSRNEVSDDMRKQIQARLDVAGVEVSEALINHLAYAPEIAQVMLRRQQAEAVIAARQRIVEGAVGMVQHALQLLSESKVVELDEERKAAMINNLLVALVSESQATPVINTGTLYT